MENVLKEVQTGGWEMGHGSHPGKKEWMQGWGWGRRVIWGVNQTGEVTRPLGWVWENAGALEE